MLILLVFAFLAGIATILSPCILPILPALLAASTFKGRLRPLGIIVGLIASFTFFTLALAAIVQVTGLSPNLLRYVAIGLIILFGLIMLFPKLSDGFANLTTPIATLGQTWQGNRSGFLGGALFGSALGLLWTPCAGPILAAVTSLVATQAFNFQTLFLTLAYSLGAAIPMFLIAYGSSRILQTSHLFANHAEAIRRLFGGLMILTGVAIALHWDMKLQLKLASYLPTIIVEDNTIVKQELDKLHQLYPSESFKEITISGEISQYGKAPEIQGIINWINSPPLSLMQLQGKVILIDFWTYSCINCLRTLPYIEKWYADYKDKGFLVIGVHTPEFEFEKDPQNVAEAAARLGILYPIAQDNDYKTWNAYKNHYWPAHYLIDQKGQIRMIHFGEGAYADTENAIRELLALPAIAMTEPLPSHRPLTAETYLGYARGRNYALQQPIQLNKVATYTSAALKEDYVGLKGAWKIEEESIQSESDESYLDLSYLAKQVYLVLAGSSKTAVEVYLDGQLHAEFRIDGDRKYDIIMAPYGRHTVSLKIPKDIRAYAFTFGDD